MNAATDSSYFDLHASGIGYLNRARVVEVKGKGRKAEPFLAVTVGALRGSSDDVQYTYFDCRVSGAEAQAVVNRLLPEINAGKKVLADFRLGDFYPEPFVFKTGPKAGQTGVSIKGRLLFLAWVKVDGVTVYQAPDKAEAEPSADAEQQAPAAAA
jgi:hypothetical protein